MKTAFTHTNLIDVLTGTLLSDCTILVEDGIITDIAHDIPADVNSVINLSGKYVTPGFFDCHVHLVNDSLPEALSKKKTPVGYTLTALENLESLAKAGVTFARDVGDVHNVAIELREAIKSGRIKLAPDLQASGQPICMTGGTSWHKLGYEADGVDECRKAARLMLKNGADVVKLMGTGGVCTEGTKRGSIQLSEEEIRAGVDIIEHGDNVDDKTVQMMVEHGTIYDAGVLCILGSNSGTQFCHHTDSLYEMVVMVENCGLTPAEALKIGTINSAVACDVDHILGSLTVGKKAHMVVFEENPLENIQVVMNPNMTIKNGEIIRSHSIRNSQTSE